ncbi:MAG: 2-dehydropantoate 2-reductase [Anaerolineaceae bacterium]|nr:2-dehydropantoate 2-reductase [Anaerolineaceae bacterium]
MSRIAIIGAGAIGSTFGALLSRAGHQVTLTGRTEQLNAIDQNGLTIEGALGTFTTHPKTAQLLDTRPDFAFLTVKTQDVLTALQPNLPFLTGVPLVTFQNGVQSDHLVATLLPPSQIISVVVNTGASYLTPARVTIAYPGSLVIGRPFADPDPTLEALAVLLGAVIPTRISSNIMGAHWLKLIINLNNAFPAVTNLTIPQVLTDPYLRQLAVRVMREGVKTVNGAGVQLESLADVSVNLIQRMARLPVPLAGLLLASNARRMQSDWPMLGSTLQSLRRGRPTEIDYLNGEIVRLGQQHNLPTPLNAAIVDMVHQIEKTGHFWQPNEIRAHLRAK